MKTITTYDGAVKTIKQAILESQLGALKSSNEKQLKLYYSIGKYISKNTRNGAWGTNALEIISKKLEKEMPGLRGFKERNLKNMRTFYEEWRFLSENNFINEIEIRQTRLPNLKEFNITNYLSISFSNHSIILSKVKNIEERIFYINKSANEHLSYRELEQVINDDCYHKQGKIPNNFKSTIKDSQSVAKAIMAFKDEYSLDYVNVEEIDARDKQDVDERVLENQIVHNIKKFILTFGKSFAFVGNQYHLEAFGEDQYIDLLFFNRELNCLVAIELKKGEFKTSYLGQLNGYLSILNKYERLPHENPPIGIVLCKNANKSFVDFVIGDYSNPMGVSTYKTSIDMSQKLKDALPDIEDLRKLIDDEGDN